MRQKSEQAEEKELESSHLVTDSVSLRTIEEAENDSGTETLQDTDSEPEDLHSKQEELIQENTGLNVSKFAIAFVPQLKNVRFANRFERKEEKKNENISIFSQLLF